MFMNTHCKVENSHNLKNIIRPVAIPEFQYMYPILSQIIYALRVGAVVAQSFDGFRFFSYLAQGLFNKIPCARADRVYSFHLSLLAKMSNICRLREFLYHLLWRASSLGFLLAGSIFLPSSFFQLNFLGLRKLWILRVWARNCFSGMVDVENYQSQKHWSDIEDEDKVFIVVDGLVDFWIEIRRKLENSESNSELKRLVIPARVLNIWAYSDES